MEMKAHAVRRSLPAVAAVLLAATVLTGPALGAGKDDAPVAGASKMAPPPANEDPKVPFEKYVLDNGLEVILIQDNRTPVVYVSVWYHVGSGDEVVGKSGFAHLFEHMMFQGTKNTGEDKHFEILKSIGVSDVNGTTTSDRTNYYEQVPSNQLDTALWLESERMGYLLPMVTEKSLANQIDVVRNERRQNYDNVPYMAAYLKMLDALYPEGHPYKYATIGRHEDLVKASVTDVKNFFKKWYVPANATLVIAGDFESGKAKEAVQKWFGGFPKTTRPAHVSVPVPVITKTQRLVVEDKLAKLRSVDYVWHSPAAYAPGDAELRIMAAALGDSGTGRLYRALVIDRGLARSVSVRQGRAQLSATFDIGVYVNPEADLAEVEKVIDAELDRALQEPITEREFKRVVTRIEAGFIWGLESLSSRSEALQGYNHYVGDPDYISRDLDRYRTSSPAKVQAIATAFLKKTNRIELIVMPAGGK